MTGCVTQQQVKAIVTETNAAMVSPYLQAPKNGEEGVQEAWQQAVTKIDRLIAAHPDQAVLVNHLRVRQAMLLTVNKQQSLAEMRWDQVDAGNLENERERAFYQCRVALVFAYNGLTANLNPAETASLTARRSEIDTALQYVETRDIRVYLRMVQAHIALKQANEMDEENEQKEIQKILASGLNAYVGEFSKEALEWVKANYESVDEEGLTIGEFRDRYWLRGMIKSYVGEASNSGLSPEWSPKVKAILN
jgi:hypothetical protein